MGRHYKQIDRDERMKIEALYTAGYSIAEIAKQMNRNYTTIYREIRRGRATQRNTDWTERTIYSADLAQMKYEVNKKQCGRELKTGNDYKFLHYIEKKIADEKYSPAATLMEIKKENIKFDTEICLTTLYNYIKSGVFLNLTLEELPYRRKKKKATHRRVQKRLSAGTSISERPEEILERDEFGHWEMDTVVGAQGKGKKSLLVLTERKTRFELLFLLKDHTSNEVVKALDKLERRVSEKNFREIFKTITVDNGTEFSDTEGIQKSRRNKRNRTKLYYCHAYRSCERGSNENQNKLVRRWHPKGTIFDTVTKSEIIMLQNWINEYPRKLFDGGSAKEILSREDYRYIDILTA